jgi:hypothetical protein
MENMETLPKVAFSRGDVGFTSSAIAVRKERNLKLTTSTALLLWSSRNPMRSTCAAAFVSFYQSTRGFDLLSPLR